MKYWMANWYEDMRAKRSFEIGNVFLGERVLSIKKETEKAVLCEVQGYHLTNNEVYGEDDVWLPKKAFVFIDMDGVKYFNERNAKASTKWLKSLKEKWATQVVEEIKGVQEKWKK